MFLINNQRVKHCNKTCWLKKCPDIFCSYNLKAKHLSSLHKGCTLTHRASALTYHSKSKTKITIAINRNLLQQSSCTNSKTTRLPAASWCLSQNLIYRLGSAYLNILCKMHSTIKCREPRNEPKTLINRRREFLVQFAKGVSIWSE